MFIKFTTELKSVGYNPGGGDQNERKAIALARACETEAI